MEKIKFVYRKLPALIALLTIEVIVTSIAFIGSVILFLIIYQEIFFEKEEIFDHKVFHFLSNYITEDMTNFMQILSFFGSRNFLTFACLAIFLYTLLVRQHKWYSLIVPVISITTISLNLILKNLFNRPRPFLPHLAASSGLSFPSGHAMISFAFYGFLIFLAWRNIQNKALKISVVLFLLLFIHLIGLSRVYLRVHYASDVLAGFCVGTIWLVISIFILKKIEQFSGRKIEPILEE